MHGLYLLWWVEEKQVPPATVAAILAAGDLALLCLELPTGWFADRVGHRASLVAASAVQLIGMIWCWLGEGVIGLVAATVLVALGDAFRSGADAALAYRTCHALGRGREFQAIEARANAVALGALVALVLAGGLIVTTWGFAAGWIAEAALSAAGLAIALAMTEPPPTEPPPTAAPEERRCAASRSTGRVAGMAALILPTGILAAAASAAAFLAQTSGMRDAEALTVMVAAFTLAEAAGSMAAARMAGTGVRVLLALCALGVACFALSVAQPGISIAMVILLAFLTGIAEPLRAVAIQHMAADAARARAASLASACDMVFMLIALPLSARLWGRRR
jgi:predicted MFS family arabinose efflux permease